MEGCLALKRLYREIAETLVISNRIVKYSECQDYQNLINLISILAQRLPTIINAFCDHEKNFEKVGLDISTKQIIDALKELLDCQNNQDYVLYGDVLRLEVIPVLMKIQDSIRCIEDEEELLFQNDNLLEYNNKRLSETNAALFNDVCRWRTARNSGLCCETRYYIETTMVGFPTIAIEYAGKKYYLHSNYDPYNAAANFATYNYDINVEEYIIYGLGLAYHVEELEKKNRSARIVVYESDIAIIYYMLKYRDLKWLWNNENICIVYDPDFSLFREKISKIDDGMRMVINRPSVNCIHDKTIRKAIERVAIRNNSVKNELDNFLINSKINIKLCDGYVDELKNKFFDKTVIIVAAGPSLDKNVMFLKQLRHNIVVVAVGAVFKKLYKLGVQVDYVIVTDPKQETWKQLEGIGNTDTPILLLSTAVREIAEQYTGKKYVICQKEFDDAERYAAKNGWHLYNAGGSVVTVALDVAIYFEARKIICIGLDLAFTGNQMHAKDGGVQGSFAELEDMIPIESVDGDIVYTSYSFDSCRRWIEQRLLQNDVTMPVYDATEGGALIHGMHIAQLKELV